MSQDPMAATPEPLLVTPGAGRLITFQIGGHSFAYRRPSRQDQAEAAARTALRLQMAGAPDQQSWTNWLNFLDGYRLQWETRLEIGLRPARNRSGQVVNLGERAPAHWLESVHDAQGNPVDQVVSFVQVDPDEFDAVVAHIEAILKKKRATDPEQYRYCNRPDQRVIWGAWKQWPALVPWDDLTACDDAEVAWVEMQQLIDRGLRCCETCDAFGWHEHCGSCGRRYVGAELKRRDCPKCKAVVVTDYCVHCGEWVAIPFLKRLEAGEVDWLAEAEEAGKLLAKLSRNTDLVNPAGPDPTGRAAAIAAVLKRVALPAAS